MDLLEQAKKIAAEREDKKKAEAIARQTERATHQAKLDQMMEPIKEALQLLHGKVCSSGTFQVSYEPHYGVFANVTINDTPVAWIKAAVVSGTYDASDDCRDIPFTAPTITLRVYPPGNWANDRWDYGERAWYHNGGKQWSTTKDPSVILNGLAEGISVWVLSSIACVRVGIITATMFGWVRCKSVSQRSLPVKDKKFFNELLRRLNMLLLHDVSGQGREVITELFKRSEKRVEIKLDPFFDMLARGPDGEKKEILFGLMEFLQLLCEIEEPGELDRAISMWVRQDGNIQMFRSDYAERGDHTYEEDEECNCPVCAAEVAGFEALPPQVPSGRNSKANLAGGFCFAKAFENLNVPR